MLVIIACSSRGCCEDDVAVPVAERPGRFIRDAPLTGFDFDFDLTFLGVLGVGVLACGGERCWNDNKKT